MTASLNWEAISAISNAIMALGVLLVLAQINLTKRIAQLQFEDGLAKEYRDLSEGIPTKVFLGEPLSNREFQSAQDEFFRYLDLSNEQVALRMSGRISRATWESWCEGIASNLQLPAFAKAWVDIKERTSIFRELRFLESVDFKSDPATWKVLPSLGNTH